MPVVTDIGAFDRRSGNWLERIIFNHRLFIVIACVLITGLLGWQASKLEVNASFEKMIPQSHPYIRNYLANEDALRQLGNSIRIVVENTKGDIYDKDYLQKLQKINDTIFLLPGVDRSFMKSLWTPAVRWNEITEEGYRGGPVMPDSYDGSAASIATLRGNVAQAGIVGSIVASDQKSSLVFVPLLDKDPVSGKAIDYGAFSRALESQVRSMQDDSTHIHIVGFAKLAGDLIDGLQKVIGYFAIATLIAAVIIFLYTRCVRSTVLVLACSFAAAIWQLGIVRLLGFVLDPYSVLVPFLVFAVGVSHGAQKMNGIMQDVGRGTHRYVAARYTFRRLFLAGLTALLADAVGFAVLMLIDIRVIHDLAITASIGIAVLIFTNLVLLPVVLSYTGVSRAAAQRTLQEENKDKQGLTLSGRIIAGMQIFTERRWATIVIAVSVLLGAAGFMVSLHLKIGDLDPGAPELRPQSRYNQDNAYITSHYGLSSDQFAVIVTTPPGGIDSFQTLLEMDRLGQKLRALDGVQTVISVASVLRFYTAGNFEGNPKWATINRSPFVLQDAMQNVLIGNPELGNQEGSVAPVLVYLKDHRAETLTAVVDAVKEFSRQHDTQDRKFLLAAGSAGIEAATNIVVRRANAQMLFLVYAAVIILCFITFRSWRAVIVAVLPLALTSILCEALMVLLGIGVKVATLPVIALGVGIGVDYSLYLLSVQLAAQRNGASLGEAYHYALNFTGKVVALVGITLAAGVITWAWSPIKFQADMGILLTFMFVWNMIGALILIPALSHFLLRGVGKDKRAGAANVHALAGQPVIPETPEMAMRRQAAH